MAESWASLPQHASTAPSRETGARAPLIVVDDFLSAAHAEAMRADIERHFADPDKHRPESHQIWNYWFVPGLYTYLRTAPEKLILRDRIEGFVDALKAWSISALALAEVSWPYLSLYIDGCRQGLHNDARNGRFGFVYSLSRDERRTIGGETLVMREGDPFRRNIETPAAGRTFFDAVAPRFNRLVVFDDRLPHAVNPVEGSMDPIDGRIVLHGHLREGGTIVVGALPPTAVAGPIALLLKSFTTHAAARIALYRGVIGLRLAIEPGGCVADCAVLADRVVHPDGGDVEWEPLRQELVARFAALDFPPAAGRTDVVLPVVLGAALPG